MISEVVKKLLIIFCLIGLFLSCSSVFAKGATPTPTPTSTVTVKEEYTFASMTTYEMFWPIVAGKIPGDRFYDLKALRDKLAGYLFFSKVKKSEYLKQLANKRLVEAEKLIEIKRYSLVPQTLEDSSKNLEEGLSLLFSAEETPQTFWLKDEYRKDFKKHVIVLERMKDKVTEEQKSLIEKSLESINGLIEKYQLKI